MPVVDLKAHEGTVCFKYDQEELRECGKDETRCDAFCVQGLFIWAIEVKNGNVDLKQANKAIKQINESLKRTEVANHKWAVKKLILGNTFTHDTTVLMGKEKIEHSELGHIDGKYGELKTVINRLNV